MVQLPKKLVKKLEERRINNSLRQLTRTKNAVDFSSNDYLGFSRTPALTKIAQGIVNQINLVNGATGSRLLTGNHSLFDNTEDIIKSYHKVEAALLFNSGYDANLGLLSSVPQRNDVVFYDELCHASIRDALQLSNAKSQKFKHNNFIDLKAKLKGYQSSEQQVDNIIYVVTESVFSMDGDSPDLEELADLCMQYKAYLIVDEAHALGVFGRGLVANLKLSDKVFATIVTFGKALGSHGAAVLGSTELKTYLINYARSLIYTTAQSPHSVATIYAGYQLLDGSLGHTAQKKLTDNIQYFKDKVEELALNAMVTPTKSAIQIIKIGGNTKTKTIANQLQEKGFDVRAILAPTVPAGSERLRICLHAFNSFDEINAVLQLVKQNILAN